jgi:hypothetical protein
MHNLLSLLVKDPRILKQRIIAAEDKDDFFNNYVQGLV